MDQNLLTEKKYEPYTGNQRLLTALRVVYEYVRAHLDVTESAHTNFSPDEVFVVWFCKTLGNWKALLSTTLPDGMYYEVTYNGNGDELYLDAYKKFENVVYLQDSGGHWHAYRKSQSNG